MLRENILKVLQGHTETTINVIAQVMELMMVDRSSSYRVMKRTLARQSSVKHFKFQSSWAAEYSKKQRFYKAFNDLKRQGFITKESRDGVSSWKITRSGQARLRKLNQRSQPYFQKGFYRQEEDALLKIVIFDVPERYRHKRAWLRSVLVALGFTFLQKSVWMGKKKIPTEFLDELSRHDMMGLVHIFAISKTGTLKSVE